MVRFSCFLSSINQVKPKKTGLQSAGAMNSSPKDTTLDQVRKPSVCSESNPSNTSAEQVTCPPSPAMDSNLKEISQDQIPIHSDNHLSNTSAEQATTPSSHGGGWKSDDLGNSCGDESEEFCMTARLKKTQSLGSMLDKRKDLCGNDITEEGEMDHDYSVDYFHDNNLDTGGDPLVNDGLAEAHDLGGIKESTFGQLREKDTINSLILISDPERRRSIFSIEVCEEQHDSDAYTTGHIGDSSHSLSNILPALAKSHSAASLTSHPDSSAGDGLPRKVSGPRSRSFEDLCSDLAEHDELFNDENTVCSEEAFQRHLAASYNNTPEPSDLDGKGSPCHADSKEECTFSNTSGGLEPHSDKYSEAADKYSDEKPKNENRECDGFEIHSDDILARKPETDGLEIQKNVQQDSSIQNCDQLTSDEFNMRRIQDWISQIDIQNAVVEELGESSGSSPKRESRVSRKDSHVMATGTITKNDAHLSMEVAYKYISSLAPSSTSAYMSNLGLVAVPFLGAFASLRVLSLSGNAIVRITAGALPRGLHMLNLSKNNISTIEGLRDLTRLRVLDLSYNRILRIGHGLASCSSLKELYLAGNMISEVEGLHRLLKLNVLDLRFNKISKAKGLDRLAANYGSLQAIALEGNPAQVNVGGEQLKKYVMNLLPRLVYYNKQTTRAGSSKDATDRSMRSLSSHQFDRGMRTEQNNSRRGSHGSGLHRSISSSNVRAAGVSSSLKPSKNRHVRLPPAVSKVSTPQLYPGPKVLSSRLTNPIHRSSSEGTL